MFSRKWLLLSVILIVSVPCFLVLLFSGDDDAKSTVVVSSQQQTRAPPSDDRAAADTVALPETPISDKGSGTTSSPLSTLPKTQEEATASTRQKEETYGGADDELVITEPPLTRRRRKVRPQLRSAAYLLHQRRPLPVVAAEDEPIRLNLVVPYVGRSLTGGPLSIIWFAIQAAKAGLNVRWIQFETQDVVSKSEWIEIAKKYRLGDFVQIVDIVGVKTDILCNPKDQFVATIFHSPEIALQAVQKLGYRKSIIYFIQDFEPLFMNPGTQYYWLALEGYMVPHFPIYSTKFLADFFKEMKYGLYGKCRGAEECNRWSHVAEPTVKRHAPLDLSKFPPNRKRKLVCYARDHVPRNAYGGMTSAISLAVKQGVFGENPANEWEFIGVGAESDELLCGLGDRDDVCLDNYAHMPEPMYLELLSRADIGFSLMMSPHPSLPPIDFASAGMIAVTNSYPGKSEESLRNVSRNIIAKLPQLPDLVAGLREAVGRVDDIQRRKEDAESINWASSWGDERCYGPSLFKKILEWQNDPLGPAKYEGNMTTPFWQRNWPDWGRQWPKGDCATMTSKVLMK